MAYQGNSNNKDEGIETRKVSKEEAAFILGQGGKTKAKLCYVSGAQIDLTEGKDGRTGPSQLQVRGTPGQRKAAMKYINFVIAQRLGPVKIEDPSAHDDLTILVVPADTVSFITGKQGSFLRLVEEEWKTLLFFLQVNPKNPPLHVDPNHTERLAIFGLERRRRGAELKVMAAIEMKMPGHFTRNVKDFESTEEGFGTDTMTLKDEDYSYALGRSGSTRRKLARASSCIVEYVGRVAYFCGTRKERSAAKEYLQWLLYQRVGEAVHVDHKDRQDVTVMSLPSNCIGYVTGTKGASLRAIEEETSTFCFIEGTVDDGEEHKPLLIFGCPEDRRLAETLVWEKISQKFDDGHSENQQPEKGGKRAKGKGKWEGKWDSKGGKDRDREYGKGGKDYGKDYSGKDYSYGKDHGWGRGKGKGHYNNTGGGGGIWPPQMGPGQSLEGMDITDDDAAFLMGPSGKTKRKIAAVSGAQLELKTNRLEIVGTKEERDKAKKYIHLVMAQRVGPVRLEDVDQHDDLSIIEVPADAVSFVTGKQGSFLRLVEEDFGTLLFFIDFSRANKRDQLELLAIFGPLRERRGAELKVMAAIEMKQPGYFTSQTAVCEDETEGFATDRMHIEEEDYSYALGKGGTTRKKIARASGCVIEYIGRLAYLSGSKQERVRAREYLGWLFRQRVGPVEVDYSNRDDVTVLQVPKDCVGFVTGHKGTSLRAVEDATGTFCFIEGGRDDPHRDPKPLLIFGEKEARQQAEEMLQRRIDLKLVEGWVHEDYSGYGGYNDGKGGDKGKHRDRGGGRGPRSGKAGKGNHYHGESSYTAAEERGGGYDRPYSAEASQQQAHDASADTAARNQAAEAEQEEDGGWGDWGGSSSDGSEDAAPAASPPAPAVHQPQQKPSYAEGLSPYRAQTVAAASPVRSGEELELPPQLLHEEAWPELGQMGQRKGKR